MDEHCPITNSTSRTSEQYSFNKIEESKMNRNNMKGEQQQNQRESRPLDDRTNESTVKKRARKKNITTINWVTFSFKKTAEKEKG